jgi:predicted enzyme related to lactoylglutathione lyase
MSEKPKPGTIGWMDLTVKDASKLRDFYAQVVGWTQDRSMAKCKEGGGRVISGPRDMGSYGRFCVIQDPAGAVAGLIQPA